MNRSEPRLAWAYVARTDAGEALPAFLVRQRFGTGDGRLDPSGQDREFLLVPVTSYASLPRQSRPRAFCPVCLERVNLRLGNRNRHHYGHRPQTECSAASGEGALHLSAKIHLANELAAGGASLTVRHVCARVPDDRNTERCPRPDPVILPLGWDEVRVEYTAPSVRADVMLLQRGREVAAIEVYAHHEVDAVKSSKYRRLGLAWIEVAARALLPEGGIAWSPAQALPVLQDSALPESWRCPRHQALHDGRIEHELNGVHRIAGRLLHIYRSDGGRSSGEVRMRPTVLYMLERREAGEIVEAWLERDDTDARVGRPVRSCDRNTVREQLHREFQSWVRWMRRNSLAVIDSPMRWTEPSALDDWKRSPASYPERLRWDTHAGGFVGAPNSGPLAWPRLAPGQGRDQPDPVLGYRESAWTQLHPAKPPLLNVICGAVWLTGRLQRTGSGGGEGSVAHVGLSVHDGLRWCQAPGVPFVLAREWRIGADGHDRWTSVLRQAARDLQEIPAADILEASSGAAVTTGALMG